MDNGNRKLTFCSEKRTFNIFLEAEFHHKHLSGLPVIGNIWQPIVPDRNAKYHLGRSQVTIPKRRNITHTFFDKSFQVKLDCEGEARRTGN